MRYGIIARTKKYKELRRERKKNKLNEISTDKIKNRNASNFMCMH